MDVTPRRWQAHPASPHIHALAEAPVWDGPRERLFWVDITAGALHEGRLDADRIVRINSRVLDRNVSAVAVGMAGELLVTGCESLLVIDVYGEVTQGPSIVPTGVGRRLNDGACDPTGAFLVGTLANDHRPGGEVLVRVEADRTLTTLDDDLTISNGLAWSPDGSLLYSVDSIPGVIYVRDYPTGDERRVLVRPDGTPDGMCSDSLGDLWVALYGSGVVHRYSPEGELTGIVEVGVPQVTCVTFVGPGLDRLLITTATEELTPRQLHDYPDSGRLFLADVGVTGLPDTPWAGFDESTSD